MKSVTALGLAWVPLLVAGVPGDDDQRGPAPTGERSLDSQSGPATTPRLAAAADEARRAGLRSALAWISAPERARADGSWETVDARVECQGAVSALATLALLAGGSTPDRGQYGARVARGTDYLLSRAVLDASATDRGFVGTLDAPNSAMHTHGFALLALAEAYSVSPATRRGARLAEVLPLAVGLIESTQGAEGGWEYEPKRIAAHEGSVTICLVQGLRAARNAGIDVDGTVIARADDYVRRSQAPDGLFRYTLGSPERTVALTAAAIATLNATGSYDDPVIRQGVDAIWRRLAERDADGSTPDFPFYERFYLVQALWQLSDPSHFERWYEQELERVLDSQRDDGSWRNSSYGDTYATAMNALFLAVPDALLPILQR
ncbi:MAG: hypothetical protein ACYSWX_05710 [Planctomycetota bacterium]